MPRQRRQPAPTTAPPTEEEQAAAVVAEEAPPAPIAGPAATRFWRVPAVYADETGNILFDDFGIPVQAHQELAIAQSEVQAILLRAGGVVSTAAERVTLKDGSTITLALTYRWQSFTPVQAPPAAAPTEETPAA